LKRHKNVLTEKEHKQTTYAAYPEIDGDLMKIHQRTDEGTPET
jgi:hypothetical protein